MEPAYHTTSSSCIPCQLRFHKSLRKILASSRMHAHPEYVPEYKCMRTLASPHLPNENLQPRRENGKMAGSCRATPVAAHRRIVGL